MTTIRVDETTPPADDTLQNAIATAMRETEAADQANLELAGAPALAPIVPEPTSDVGAGTSALAPAPTSVDVPAVTPTPDVTPTSTDTPTDPATPAPDAPSQAPSDATSPSVAAEGGTGPGVAGAQTPAPLPDHYDILGYQVTPAQAEAALNLYGWAQSLTPEQHQYVSLVRDLTPDQIARVQATLAPPTQQQVAPQPAPPQAAPPAPVVPADPFEDPAVTALRAELAELRAQVAPQQQAAPPAYPQPQPQQQYAPAPEYRAQYPQQQPPQQQQFQGPDAILQQQVEAQRAEVAQSVLDATQTAYDLSAAELELLTQRAATSGAIQFHLNNGLQFKDAIEKALDQTVWSDAFFREKALARTGYARTDEVAARREASTALSSSPGSVQREAPVQRPTTRKGIVDAMAADFAVAMGQNQ